MGKTAVIAVDVQKDFLSGGALAVPDGDCVIEPLATVAETIGIVVATADEHPKGSSRPVHCVSNTKGAKIHREILDLASEVVLKECGGDGVCSAFQGETDDEGISLADWLREIDVTKLVIGGLAAEGSVRATVLDALDLGFEVQLLTDGIRSTNPDAGQKAIDEMTAAGATCIDTRELILGEIKEALGDLGLDPSDKAPSTSMPVITPGAGGSIEVAVPNAADFFASLAEDDLP